MNYKIREYKEWYFTERTLPLISLIQGTSGEKERKHEILSRHRRGKKKGTKLKVILCLTATMLGIR